MADSPTTALKRSEDQLESSHNGNLENGTPATGNGLSADEPALKRVRLDEPNRPRERIKGVAPIKEEYLILNPGQSAPVGEEPAVDDDAAEGQAYDPRDQQQNSQQGGKRKKQKGQNKEREFGTFSDAVRLCNSVAWTPEFSPRPCKFGDRCNALHDIRKYLSEGRRPDLETFGGKCPVYETHGTCSSGWRCLYVRSHMEEIEREDGRKELVLKGDSSKTTDDEPGEARLGVVNVVPPQVKIELSKKKTVWEKSERYLEWMAKDTELARKHYHKKKDDTSEQNDYRAQYVEPPFKPSEKRKVYFGPETPVLAPLTTQGNLPFRRLCVELGAQVTYSEMALGLPLLQGQKADWTLMRAHESEITPPRFNPSGPVVQGYDNSKDLKFGVQITAHAPWIAVKATEALTRFLPHLRVVDLNCGCPVDMIYKSGAGSALLDAPAKLERMIRGMNVVSGEVPITTKIRMGVKDDKLTAQKLIERLALGSADTREQLGAPGCAAVTLHGRTRQQRYTKAADYNYIAQCAVAIKEYNRQLDAVADTIKEPDESTLPSGGKMYFIGNGDLYSHVDYYSQLEKTGVDALMLGRGPLIKPWLFSEIEQGQYLDKSAAERLTYVEKFARYGMEAWGSDELGINYTRRFMLEWLSFFTRYIPIGVLEHLPPVLNDRPPAYRARDDLETLLTSKNYKDWIKISEMFLGPAPPNFKFQPKHKSNSYEIEAEG
ncbi:hypothetical protein V8F06_000120 [Rhypophila decipiens]